MMCELYVQSPAYVYDMLLQELRELHPHAAMLTTSQFPDKAGIIDEEGYGSVYD